MSELLEHHETSMCFFRLGQPAFLPSIYFHAFYRFNLASSLTIKSSGKVQWENGAYANVKPIERLIFSKHG